MPKENKTYMKKFQNYKLFQFQFAKRSCMVNIIIEPRPPPHFFSVLNICLRPHLRGLESLLCSLVKGFSAYIDKSGALNIMANNRKLAVEYPNVQSGINNPAVLIQLPRDHQWTPYLLRGC